MKENKKKENKKEQGRYEAPQLTVVSFRTERGFASSSVTTLVTLFPSGQNDSGMTEEVFDDAGNLWTY